jgi:hypothetical protein
MTEQTACEICGVLVEIKSTGRPRKYCEPCSKKQRKDYDARRYRVKSPKKSKRAPRYSALKLSTVEGSQASLGALKQYEKSTTFKDLQNYGSGDLVEGSDYDHPVGGSGYNYPLEIPKHVRPKPKKEPVRNAVKMTEELREFLWKLRHR